MSNGTYPAGRRSVHRRGLFLLPLLAGLLIAGHGLAADVELKIGAADTPVPGDTLEDAINIANSTAAANGQYGTIVEITLNADQTKESGTGGDKPLFLIYGGTDPDNPTSIGTTHGGFESVKITGSGDSYRTIGFSKDDTTRNRVMEIVNVGKATSSMITLNKLHITNGHLKDDGNQTYIGGGGLYVGAASGATKYTDPGMFAANINLAAMKFSGNSVELSVNNSGANEMRAAIGGGAFIDATHYTFSGDYRGGKVTLSQVVFEKNSVTMTSTNANGGTGSSAFGGGLRVKNADEFKFTGGTFSENSVKTVWGSHAAGGGMVIDDFTKTATLSGITFSGNTATAENAGLAAGGVSKAMGGGLYTYHDGSNGEQLSLKVSSTTFEKNVAEAKGVNVDAYGGGVYLNGESEANFSSDAFKENVAKSADGNAYGGAVGTGANKILKFESGTSFTKNSVEAKLNGFGGAIYGSGPLTLDYTGVMENSAKGATAKGGGVYAVSILSLKNNTLISKNTVDGTTTGQGGGVYAHGATTIETVSVNENEAKGATNAQGGGLYALGTVAAQTAEFSKNKATGDTAQGGAIFAEGAAAFGGVDIAGNAAAGTTLGQGGGLYAKEAVTMTGSAVTDNTVEGDTAQGGGIYAEKTVSLTNTTISGNAAKGSTPGATFGQGGAIFAMGETTIKGGSISKNSASGDTAQGGAIYAQDDVTLEDGSITDNVATGTTASAGGAIFMDVDAGAEKVTLKATADKTVLISGNKAGANASGLHYYGTGATNAILDIDSEGLVSLLDPVTVDMTGAGTFTIDRAGAGTFKWGGANSFKVGGGAIVNLDAGHNYLTADFSAKAEGATDMTLNIGGIFEFDGARDADKAMFEFGGGTNTITLDSGTVINIDMSSELLGGTHTYLLAENYDGVSGWDGNSYAGSNSTTVVTVDSDDKVWLTTTYSTVYQGLIDSIDPNTRSAIDAGVMADAFRELTDEQRQLLTSSSAQFNNFTPGWYMNQTLAGQEILISGASAARKFGLDASRPAGRRFTAGRGYASIDDEYVPTGVRFWTGYIGDFERVDNNGGYYGYNSDRHGFVAGLSYDNGYFGSIGIYGGYSHAKTEAKTITADVKSDTGHAGIIGRVSPLREMPQLSLSGDLSYTFSSNSSNRGIGSLKTTGDFDQKYYSVGLELDYSARFGNAFARPFLSARYVRVKQEGFEESGVLAARVDDVDGNSFNTHLGAAFGVDVETPFGRVTPQASVAWRHDFGDTQYSSNAFFKGAANPVGYRIKSSKMDRDSVDISAMVRAQLKAGFDRPLGVNVGYNLNAGSNRKNHSFYVGIDLGF